MNFDQIFPTLGNLLAVAMENDNEMEQEERKKKALVRILKQTINLEIKIKEFREEVEKALYK